MLSWQHLEHSTSNRSVEKVPLWNSCPVVQLPPLLPAAIFLDLAARRGPDNILSCTSDFQATDIIQNMIKLKSLRGHQSISLEIIMESIGKIKAILSNDDDFNMGYGQSYLCVIPFSFLATGEVTVKIRKASKQKLNFFVGEGS